MKKLLPQPAFFKIALLLLTTFFSTVAIAQSPKLFTATGNFTLPYGATSTKVELWGGGGAGGGSTNKSAGGGGGGAYSNTSAGLTPGTNYIFTIGAGGTGGAGNGPAGGVSTFPGLTANGGNGGGVGTTSNGIAGTGGTATGGTVNWSGGAGAAGAGGYSGGGGGGGGSLAAGSAATNQTGAAGGTVGGGTGGNGSTANGAGTAGTLYGGGGGGAKNATFNGGSGGGGAIKFTYLCAAPAAQPTALSLTAISTSQIDGSFNGLLNVDGYIVIRTSTAIAPSGPVNGTTYSTGAGAGGYVESVGTSTTFSSTGLSTATQYWYWVYSYNSVCTGTPQYNTTTPLSANKYTCCAAPSANATSLVFGTVTQTTIPFSFSAASPAPTGGYLVVRTASATAPTPIDGTTYAVGAGLGGYIESIGTGVSFTSTGLTAGTQYYYYVFSYNSSPCSPNYAATALTGNKYTVCAAPASAPTALVLTPGANQIGVSFSDPGPASTGYIVIRTNSATAPSTPTNNTTYAVGSTALGGVVESSGSSMLYTSTGLTAGTRYWFWVYGYNNTPCSGITYNTTVLSGNAYTYCAVPSVNATSLVFGTVTQTTIAFSFTAASPAPTAGYLVVRTASATAPTPANGTTYATGAGLGGYIESVGTGLSFTSTGLTAGTQYYYYVFSYNSSPCGPSYYATALSGNKYTTCGAPASAPTSLVLTPGANQIGVSFSDPGPASTGYIVIRTNSATAPSTPTNNITYAVGSIALGGVVESSGSSLSYTSTGLTAGTRYWYWVYGYNNTPCSGITYNTTVLSGNVYTYCAVPSANATSLVFGTVTQTTIAFSFTAASPAPTAGYLVVHTTSATAPTPVNGTTYAAGAGLGGYIESIGTGLSFTSTGLTAGTQYYYYVFSYNSSPCGPSYYATALTGNKYTVCAAPASAPTALVLTPGANQIGVSFSDPGPASTGYIVIRTNSATAPSTPTNNITYAVGSTALGGVVESSGSSMSYTSTGLTAGTRYWFWVYGYNNTPCSGITYNTTVLSGNAYTYCAVPSVNATSLVFGTVTQTTIAFSFTAASPAPTAGYLVVRTTSATAPTPANGTTYAAGAGLGGYIESIGTGLSFTSTGLTAGTQYYYYVFSYNSSPCGPSYYATALSGNKYTTCGAPASAPTSLVLTPGANQIGVSFSDPGPASTGYIVIRTNSATAPATPTNNITYAVGSTALGGVVESSGSSMSYTSTGLTAGTPYWFWVFGYNNSPCGGITYNTTPLSGNAYTFCAAPPASPTALILTPSANSIAGSFSASSPASSGFIVIRTATSTAPTTPSDGTNYSVGSTALGGYIESFGAGLSFTSSLLSSNTQYWYWVYGYNNTPCAGPVYRSAYLMNNSYTACTAPTAQPTAISLTTGSTSIAVSFTVASPAPLNYLVVRTTSPTAPAPPVNGTTYTVGASALGGIIDAYGSAISYTSSGLAANTQYWYWVYSVNSITCSNGPIYLTASPLTGNQWTCTAPAAQPTSLVLTTYPNTIAGLFTAASPAVSGYLVVRTNNPTAPSSPVNGTTYIAGASALGGTIEYQGPLTTFTSGLLTASTQYWYWVFAYNTTACITPAYLAASPLTNNATTASCGSMTNIATITTPGTATYNWSALSWSFGHLPTACENATLQLNNAGAAADKIDVLLNVNISIDTFRLTNLSPGPYVHIFNTGGTSTVNIDGDMIVTAPGGNKFNRAVFGNQTSTTINGNLVLGRTGGTTTDGHCGIGSTSLTPGQQYYLYGDMTFNPRAYTTDEFTVFNFNKAGTQHIYNYTLVTDTIQPELFETINIGTTNATTVIFGGTVYDGYMELAGRGGITIGVNSTMDLPGNFSMNVISGGSSSLLKMLAGSRLRLGGDRSIPGSFGVTGSNFPGGYTYNFDPTSTIEYYGSNAITQRIRASAPYQNLELVNGSGSGRAAKTNTAGVTAAASIKIKSGADWTMGSTITSNGPFDVQGNGGLYCGTNINYGTGDFTLASGGYLGMGDPAGITAGAFATGNVQVSGTRNFSTGGNYIYNGTVAQITGTGLPVTCNDLTTDNPTTVTIAVNQRVNGTNALKQGTFDIGTTYIKEAGTLSSVTGLMKANRGIVEMTGTSGAAQTIAGSWFINRNISTLIDSNTVGTTIAATAGDTLLIGSALLYGTGITNSAIRTNNNLTLLSRDTATARFGEIVTGSGNTITGNVNVERYIGTNRKWRHLAWNTASSQTATQSWMEGNTTPNANANPGYGTIVTDEKTTWATNNFDSRSVSGPSVKYYDPVTNLYTGIPNTRTYTMNTHSAYYNFVRGDRASTPANSLVSPTILRSTGTLKTGNQAFTIPASKFEAVGNPYASAIDLRGLDTVNLTGTFYVWDPKLTGIYGLGAYQTVYQSGAQYKVLPGGGSYGALSSFVDTLESGQAMFVRARAVAGTLTFKESAKTIGARTMARQGNIAENAFALLYLRDENASTPLGGTNTLLDGSLTAFDDSYNNTVDFDDALKMQNTSENSGYKRNGQILSIERRHTVVADDTLFLNLAGVRIHKYQWDIILENMDVPGRTGFFIDKYLNTSTPLDLNNTTPIVFDIQNPTGSWAPDRFMLVFHQAAVVPVRFTAISAIRNGDKTVTVKWDAENEINMQDYKIEYSANGNNFTPIGTALPTANNGGSASYEYIDGHATAGFNYYRIRGNSLNGHADYTAIAKVGPLSTEALMSINPNPVTGNTLNLRFENQPKGTYTVSISNKIGQVLHTETVSVQNGNFTKMISIGTKAAPGSYQAVIMDAAGKIMTIPFIVE